MSEIVHGLTFFLVAYQVHSCRQFQQSMSHIMYETFEEEKESIRQLAEEMSSVCNQILEDKK